MGADLRDVSTAAEAAVDAAPDGPGLDPRRVALLRYAVAASPATLDVGAMDDAARAALSEGVEPEILVEVQMLVAAIGVHALHEGVLALRALRHPPPAGAAATAAIAHRSRSPDYWERFDRELPGFADGLARWAPWAYEAFVAFAGAAVAHGRLDRLTRELVWVSADAAPEHRYVPGLLLHLADAVRAGATRAQLRETLALAAGGPRHTGIGRHDSNAESPAP